MDDRLDFEQYRQGIIDEEDLRLLPIFYWVSGAMTAFFSLYFLFYAGIGTLFLFTPPSSSSSPPPEWFAWIFIGIGVSGMLILGTIAVLKIVVGFSIRARKRRLLCLIIAGISCVEVPYGTLLGVLTFMALTRPSVQARFESAR